MDYRITPPEEILEATATLPRSTSINTRAMVMAAIASKTYTGPLAEVCDDTATLAGILSRPLQGTIDVGPAGTAMRFLCALCAATEGADCLLTGSERMLRRPIGPLVETLRSLGADIAYEGADGFPPLRIKGRRLTGGEAEIDGGTSSQFISALMMVAPLMSAPLKIRLLGDVSSRPYIAMTAEMMRRRGIDVEMDLDSVTVPDTPYRYRSPEDDDEADWSAAAFWYEIAALTAGWVTIPGLRQRSLQGDSASAELFERLGVLTEYGDEGAELSATPDLYSRFDADLSDMPDAVPALAVTAAMAGIPFRISGIGSLHDKECDRIEALIAELAKLGMLAETEEYGTVLSWDGRRRPISELPVFDTYGDHRMAMALAPVAVFVPGIVIRDAGVVAKSYPGFWDDLRRAGFTVEDAEEASAEE